MKGAITHKNKTMQYKFGFTINPYIRTRLIKPKYIIMLPATVYPKTALFFGSTKSCKSPINSTTIAIIFTIIADNFTIYIYSLSSHPQEQDYSKIHLRYS